MPPFGPVINVNTYHAYLLIYEVQGNKRPVPVKVFAEDEGRARIAAAICLQLSYERAKEQGGGTELFNWDDE